MLALVANMIQKAVEGYIETYILFIFFNPSLFEVLSKIGSHSQLTRRGITYKKFFRRFLLK